MRSASSVTERCGEDNGKRSLIVYLRTEIAFWSQAIGIPEMQFGKPYVKISKRADITYKTGSFGHGTCNVIVSDARLARRIFMGLRVFEEYFQRPRVRAGQ